MHSTVCLTRRKRSLAQPSSQKLIIPKSVQGKDMCLWLLRLEIEVAIWRRPTIRVSTAGNLLVQNGTDVSLSCTFSSAGTIGPSFSISWTFKPQNGGTSENAYPTKKGRFSRRISFEGNVMRGDASLKLRNVEFTDNGTYTCSVMNPPNIDGNIGEVKLGVVLKGMVQHTMQYFLSLCCIYLRFLRAHKPSHTSRTHKAVPKPSPTSHV
uniref:Myelin protein zero-like 2b n=1 Tax=Eptatretus burgeri TaxID=7764 RepID=A0A8C4NN07_EPTBU